MSLNITILTLQLDNNIHYLIIFHVKTVTRMARTLARMNRLARIVTRMARTLARMTRMARIVTRMARTVTRMARGLAGSHISTTLFHGGNSTFINSFDNTKF